MVLRSKTADPYSCACLKSYASKGKLTQRSNFIGCSAFLNICISKSPIISTNPAQNFVFFFCFNCKYIYIYIYRHPLFVSPQFKLTQRSNFTRCSTFLNICISKSTIISTNTEQHRKDFYFYFLCWARHKGM